MVNLRHPLRLNVGFLVNQPIGTSRDFNFEYPEIRLIDLDLTQFSGTARISRTPQGLWVQGDFEGATMLECVRCLDTYEHGLQWSFTDLYAFDERSLSESGLILPENAHIDLEPLMRDYAMIEIPINPICKVGCKGLCAVCGENWNKKDCQHRLSTPDPSFAPLKSLQKE